MKRLRDTDLVEMPKLRDFYEVGGRSQKDKNTKKAWDKALKKKMSRFMTTNSRTLNIIFYPMDEYNWLRPNIKQSQLPRNVFGVVDNYWNILNEVPKWTATDPSDPMYIRIES